MKKALYTIHGQGKKFEIYLPETNHINILVTEQKGEKSRIAKDYEIAYVKHCLAFTLLIELRDGKLSNLIKGENE